MNSSRNILKQVFGYDDFKENQEEIIQAVLKGKDAFVLMPTGSGKSICYQIPAIMGNGIGIVISPLIALMEDQVKGLRQNGVRAAYLNSTLTVDAIQKIQEKALNGDSTFCMLRQKGFLPVIFSIFYQASRWLFLPLMKPTACPNGGMIFGRNICGSVR